MEGRGNARRPAYCQNAGQGDVTTPAGCASLKVGTTLLVLANLAEILQQGA